MKLHEKKYLNFYWSPILAFVEYFFLILTVIPGPIEYFSFSLHLVPPDPLLHRLLRGTPVLYFLIEKYNLINVYNVVNFD